MILVTCSLVTVQKVERTARGESGEMYCDFRKAGKVEHIFSFFSVKNSVSQGLGGFIDGSILAGSLCNTLPRTRHNFWGSWWLS